MKPNQLVFSSLLAVLYGLICLVMLATGYGVTDCITLLGWPAGGYLAINLIAVFARMILISVADEPDYNFKQPRPWISQNMPIVSDFLADWAGRVGSAFMILLDLMPVFRTFVTVVTMCVGPLMGVVYLFSTTGPTLVTDLFQLVGQLAALWVMYAGFSFVIAAIEAADVSLMPPTPRAERLKLKIDRLVDELIELEPIGGGG